MKNRKIELTLKQIFKVFNIPRYNAPHYPSLLLLVYEKDIASLKTIITERIDEENLEDEIKKYLNYCEDSGLIKITGKRLEDYIIRQSLKNIFEGEREINEDVKDWIDDWRNIFPPGKSGGGYRLRGDKQGCIKKMESFIKDNPKVTKEEIFEATKKYVDRFNSPYNYMKLADYFIKKDNTSLLASEIEGLGEKEESAKSSLNRMS